MLVEALQNAEFSSIKRHALVDKGMAEILSKDAQKVRFKLLPLFDIIKKEMFYF